MSLPRLISPGPRDNHLVLAMLSHIRCTYLMDPGIATWAHLNCLSREILSITNATNILNQNFNYLRILNSLTWL